MHLGIFRMRHTLSCVALKFLRVEVGSEVNPTLIISADTSFAVKTLLAVPFSFEISIRDRLFFPERASFDWDF